MNIYQAYKWDLHNDLLLAYVYQFAHPPIKTILSISIPPHTFGSLADCLNHINIAPYHPFSIKENNPIKKSEASSSSITLSSLKTINFPPFVTYQKFYWDLEIYSQTFGMMPNAKNDSDEIFIISAITPNKETILHHCKKNINYDIVQYLPSEYSLLITFFKYLEESHFHYTYNGNNFDLPYLLTRADKYHLMVPTSLPLNSIDLFLYFVKYVNTLPNYKLDTVARYLLQDGKVETSIANIMSAFQTEDETNTRNILKYAQHDAQLLKKLDETYQITETLLNLSNLLSITINDYLTMNTSKLVKLYSKKFNIPFAKRAQIYSKFLVGHHRNVYYYDIRSIFENLIGINFYPDLLIEIYCNLSVNRQAYSSIAAKLKKSENTVSIYKNKILSLEPLAYQLNQFFEDVYIFSKYCFIALSGDQLQFFGIDDNLLATSCVTKQYLHNRILEVFGRTDLMTKIETEKEKINITHYIFTTYRRILDYYLEMKDIEKLQGGNKISWIYTKRGVKEVSKLEVDDEVDQEFYEKIKMHIQKMIF